MILLTRPPKPIKLTDEVQKKLTEEFKKSKKDVWKRKFITKPLLEMSNGKCCYCETKLNEEGKYMQVEHFHHKAAYPDEVVEWENLLPSCARCNGNKRDHDTKLQPIVDPTKNNPKDYFYLRDYRLRSKKRNEIGQTSIEILYINDSDGLVHARFDICQSIDDKVDKIEGLVKNIGGDIDIRDRNRIVNGIKGVLKSAQPIKEYSAIVATHILHDDSYQYIKQKLIDLNLWDDEHIKLEKAAREIMLDITD